MSSQDSSVYICDACGKRSEPVPGFCEIAEGWFSISMSYKKPGPRCVLTELFPDRDGQEHQDVVGCKHMRPSLDSYFMNIARQVATRATCLRKHVGAVIAVGGHVVSTGYNGSIRGLEHCEDEGVGCLMEDGHCVAGDTVISKFQTGHYNTGHRTVRQIYEQWQHPQKRGAMLRMHVRSAAPNGTIVPGSIKDVWLVGKKATARVTTFLGRSVVSTLDHRYLTPEGWKPLSALAIGDKVALNGQPVYEDLAWLRARYVDDKMTVQQIAKLTGVSRGLIKRRLLAQGVELREYNGEGNVGKRRDETSTYKGRDVRRASTARSRARRYALGEKCVVCEAPDDLQVHHIDGDHLNDADSNLTTLCVTCHNMAHSPHAKIEVVRFDRIVSISAEADQDVYDMTVEPHNNFVGDGFVLHNCIRTVHAEANAVTQAAKHGHATDGGTLYVTASPCEPCFKLAVSAGIVRVVFGEAYRAEDLGPKRVIEVAKQVGVELVSLATPDTAALVPDDFDTEGWCDECKHPQKQHRQPGGCDMVGLPFGCPCMSFKKPLTTALVPDDLDTEGRCDECHGEPVWVCVCPRCDREPSASEKFHACNQHRQSVADKHYRMRERFATWSLANKITTPVIHLMSTGTLDDTCLKCGQRVGDRDKWTLNPDIYGQDYTRCMP